MIYDVPHSDDSLKLGVFWILIGEPLLPARAHKPVVFQRLPRIQLTELPETQEAEQEMEVWVERFKKMFYQC